MPELSSLGSMRGASNERPCREHLGVGFGWNPVTHRDATKAVKLSLATTGRAASSRASIAPTTLLRLTIVPSLSCGALKRKLIPYRSVCCMVIHPSYQSPLLLHRARRLTAPLAGVAVNLLFS